MSERATELTTPRLRMRRARADDLPAIHAIMSDAETMRYWSTPPHETLEQTRAWLDGMLATDPAEGDEFVLEQDGQLIGKLGAWRLPEIGFFLRRDRWGQGLAAEALGAYIRYIAGGGAGCLTADVDPRNAGSLALLMRAGFFETGRASGTYEIGGRLCDSVYLRLDLGG